MSISLEFTFDFDGLSQRLIQNKYPYPERLPIVRQIVKEQSGRLLEGYRRLLEKTSQLPDHEPFEYTDWAFNICQSTAEAALLSVDIGQFDYACEIDELIENSIKRVSAGGIMLVVGGGKTETK